MRLRCFSVLSERSAPWEVDKICWNPALDALALTSFRGEIILQRLFWKKAWKSAPSSDLDVSETRISCITWSPDGKCLAASHQSPKGVIRILDLETGRQIHTLIIAPASTTHFVSTLSWIQSGTDGGSDPDVMVPWLPVQHRDTKGVQEHASSDSWFAWLCSKFPKYRTFLCVGSRNGDIHLVANGFLALVQLPCVLEPDYCLDSVESVYLDPGLRRVAAGWVAKSSENTVCCLSVFDCSTTFSGHLPNLWRLVNHVTEVRRCMDYLDSAVETLMDGWEDLLLEVDQKFSSYAKLKYLVDGSSVGDDLMVLLVFGTASPEFENFLLTSLTEKGIKQVSLFIERAFQKTYNLVSQDLSSVGSALIFHLSSLANESSETCVWTSVLKAAGSLALKIAELRGVITKSQKELRTFFSWLNQAVFDMTDTGKPGHFIQRLASEDVEFVVDFIKNNFMQIWSEDLGGKTLFKLERIGQYLKKGPVVTPVDTSSNSWIPLEQKLTARDKRNTRLFSRSPDDSLVDCVQNFHSALEEAVTELRKECSEATKLMSHFPIKTFRSSDVSFRLHVVGDATSGPIRTYCSTSSSSGLIITDVNRELGTLIASWEIHWLEKSLVVVDFQPYKDSSVLCLVKHVDDGTEQNYGLIRWKEAEYPKMDSVDRSSELSAPLFGYLERTQSSRLFVSTKRGLGCVLAECNRRVTLLDLEPSEETTTMSSLEHSILLDP